LKNFILLDGFKFFVSANNVILSQGDEKGFIPSQYFRTVEDRQGKKLPLSTDSSKTTTTSQN
jgi:hypothetical protein